MDKRFIEDSFPVKEVSEISAKEKSIRHGNISTFHIWWARRPLASSRATNYAALIPAPKDDIDWVKKRNFIIELSKLENSLDQKIINKARKDILESNGEKPLKVLDPFSGGGSIPLEALRLGCETYANDYNPVAVLIEKCTIEYPQKYGQPKDGKWSENSNPLVEDVKKWGKWVLEKTKKEIGKFYPENPDGSIPVGYLWARTIPCQNPLCGAEIPLMKQFWLSKKDNKKIVIKPFVKDAKVEFEILGQTNSIPSDFNPSKGSVQRAVATCPVCGSSIEANKTRELFQNGKSNERMIAVILLNPKKKGKTYQIATKKDMDIFNEAEKYLKQERNTYHNKWGIDPIPNEETPDGKGIGAERAFSVRNYGLNSWGDLFNSRQKLSLVIFMKNIMKAYDYIKNEKNDTEYAKSILTYLALGFDRLLDFGSTLCVLNPTGGRGVVHTFGRQTLPITWDYMESNPFNPKAAGWETACKKNEKWIENASKINSNLIKVTQSSSTSLPYESNFFNAVFTDPPYYDNVPYSYLSDFFYVWLKRMLGKIHPELFLTPLTPKKDEIVVYTYEKSLDESKELFEYKLGKSFKEIHRVLKPGGIATIVYAHKTTEGWETVINALLDSGLTVTASWPISTEMKGRLRGQNSAALASSIYIVARKLDKKELGWYKDVKQEIKDYVPDKLDKLWQEGISGADFFIAAIGSSIEIFGKYEKILDNEGNEIRAGKLLTFVRGVVTDYAMHQILHNGTAAEISPLSKFYLLWRWNYQELTLPFDEARKLAQSAGIDLTKEWNKGFITKRGDKISVQSPDKRDLKTLKEPIELIDVLHKVCLLWKTGNTNQMKETLRNSGYATNDAFYKVAQAISETLPNSSSEKKLIEGFLAGKDTIIQETKKIENPQTKLI